MKTSPAGFSAETNKSGAGYSHPTPHISRLKLSKALEKKGIIRYNESWCSSAVVWVDVSPAQGRGGCVPPRPAPLFVSWLHYSIFGRKLQDVSGCFLDRAHSKCGDFIRISPLPAKGARRSVPSPAAARCLGPRFCFSPRIFSVPLSFQTSENVLCLL